MMRLFFYLKIMRTLLLTLLLCGMKISAQHLLPQPLTYKKKEGVFDITSETYIHLKNSSNTLKKYTKRLAFRLQNRAGIVLKTPEIQDTSNTHEIKVECLNVIDSIGLYVDESYNLTVSASSISIKAKTNIGAYRAMETLLQLIETNKKGAFIKSCSIDDKPRFQWRGLLIDVCRHWIPANIIKQNIDAMAAVKMNVLHLHLTDDQGFRIESKKFPLLHKLGNDGNYLSQEEIKDIIKYAKERGIRVIPEIDIPGHSTSWLVGYPKLASIKREYKTATRFGIFKGTINPINDYTYDFLDTLLTEMSQLFPDAYFHIGGDENNGIDWDNNKKIQKFMIKNELKSNQELQAHFNRKILDILTRNKKTMIGWDEIYHEKIPNSITIQSWRGKESITNAAKNGYTSLLSNGFYLDKVQSIKHYYENEPIPSNSNLTAEEQKMILGGEATMWTELTDQTNINSRIWPSTLAIAERLWSEQSNCNTNNLYIKTPFISNQLEEFGLNHLSFQEIKLKNMSNNSAIHLWKPFIEILEPVKGYKRHVFMKKNTSNYNNFAPLNRIADACFVESFTARRFNELVKRNCDGEYCKQRDKIKFWLAKWVEATENYQKISSTSKSLYELNNYATYTQEICELAWRKINSSREFSEKDLERAQKIIRIIENYDIDIQFAPISGIKIIIAK